MKMILHKIVMPFSMRDYERGFLYTLAYVAKQETGRGSGVELKDAKEDKEFKLPDGTSPDKCTYTHKIYHCDRFVSNFVRKLAYKWFGKNSLKFIEHAWNAYPYMETKSHNMEKPDKVEFVFQSMHFNEDKGRLEKPTYIWDSEHLKNKNSFKGVNQIEIDITEKMKKLKKFDPTQVKSQKAGIGPLPQSQKKKPWYEQFEGTTMCCYKFSKTRFDIMFGGTMEKKFAKQQDFTFKKFHKMIYCLMDEWWDMTLEEILQYEADVNKELGINLNREDIELEGGGFGDDSGSEAPDANDNIDVADKSKHKSSTPNQEEKEEMTGGEENKDPDSSKKKSDAKKDSAPNQEEKEEKGGEENKRKSDASKKEPDAKKDSPPNQEEKEKEEKGGEENKKKSDASKKEPESSKKKSDGKKGKKAAK